MGYKLLCLGNPLLDIQARGSDELLAKYGLKADDAILAAPSHAAIYDELLGEYEAKLVAGGAAQNTARGAQYLLDADSVAYLGGVGDDKYATILRDAVRDAGLRVEYRVDAALPTGRCAVIITGHNRSMCTDLGAASSYDAEHLKKPDTWRLVETAGAFFIGGYHFSVCPAAIMALAEHAAAADKPFIISLSAPFIPTAFKEAVDASSPFWDYVVGNEAEAAAWAAAHDLPRRKADAGAEATAAAAPGDEHDGYDLMAVASALADLPKRNAARPRVAIITRGSRPTIVATAAQPPITVAVRVLDPADICDTNGAGDAFAGGLCAGIASAKPLKECVDMGHWLARLSIQELGPSFPHPKKAYEA